MKTSNRFDKAYNSLVNAYFNGTLAKDTCVACAVGNIVADAQGAVITVDKGGVWRCNKYNQFWSSLFITTTVAQYKYDNPEIEEELYQLTGYTGDEMARVEYAFERNTRIRAEQYPYTDEQQILEDQYKGLCAVVDVMLKLEGVEDTGQKEHFRKHPKLVTM